MTRDWSCYRLLGPPAPGGETLTPLLADALPRLVGYMRAADAHGRWFFQRRGGSGNVEVAFHSTGAVRRELERLLLAESDRYGWPVLPEDPSWCAPKATLADRLADARAEFTRELSGAGEERDIELAARHLHRLLDLVPAPDRRQFLFTCWESWTRRMTPRQRIAVGDLADRSTAEIAGTALAGDSGDKARVWYRYLTAIRAGIATRPPEDTTPLNYLLFRHAHETHLALGIGAEAEAVAARALRTALVLGLPRCVPARARSTGTATTLTDSRTA